MRGSKTVFLIYMRFICICLSQQTSESPTSTHENDHFAKKYSNVVADILPISARAFQDEVSRIEAMMLPIVVASPKNGNGTLSHSSAKYALYRIFMERHGWLLENIDMSFETAGTVPVSGQFSTLFNFGGRFPPMLTNLLVGHVENRGMSTLELSLFVATLEVLIDVETSLGLQRMFELGNVPISAELYEWQVEPILQTYVACYINGLDVATATQADLQKQFEILGSTYFNWEGTKKWIHTFLDESMTNTLVTYTFEDIQKIAINIIDNFVYWNNQQCSTYKERLLQLDDDGDGRVQLLDFYRDGLKKGLFSETIVYLRDLGALDETDPADPRVIISNYVEGPNNCVARTNFYSVCCMDECSDLFSHLESSVRKPWATVDELLPLLKDLNSASMMNCRKWPSALTQELNRIAEQNDGLILLHGDQFAEFMHMAYPNECVSPLNFGPAHGVTVENWARASRHEIALSPGHVRELIQRLEADTEVPAYSRMFENTVVKPLGNGTTPGKDTAFEKDTAPEKNEALQKEIVDRKSSNVSVVSESDTAATLTNKFCIASAMVLAWKFHQHKDRLKESIPSLGESHVHWKLTDLV